MPQYPIIVKPSLLEQALAATPKPEPIQMPVIPSPGAKPKRFKVGLLVAQALVFTMIALVWAFFGEFILAVVLLAVTVGVIIAQVNAQRGEYPRRLRIWEENVAGLRVRDAPGGTAEESSPGAAGTAQDPGGNYSIPAGAGEKGSRHHQAPRQR